MSASNPPDKPCATCGRPIAWRAKWARDWDQIKYCGEKCRRNKPTAADADLERTIMDILNARARDKTMCPSEALPPDARGDKERMEEVRRAARRLVARGEIEITQGGRVVDPGDFRGPIRLRRPR